MNGALPQLAPLAIDADAEYAAGFPMHVAVTAAIAERSGSVGLLPAMNWLSDRSALGVVAVDAHADVVLKHDLVPWGNEHTPRFTISFDERRRMLVDLSPLLLPLPPGAYSLHITYGTRYHAASGIIDPFTIRAPSGHESALLAAVAPELDAAGTWSQWTMAIGPTSAALERPTESRDPLRWSRILRRLLDPRREAGVADLADLAAIEGVYVPEAAVLRAELLRFLGREEAFERAAAVLERQYPELQWWMEEIRAETSLIAAILRHRRGTIIPPP